MKLRREYKDSDTQLFLTEAFLKFIVPALVFVLLVMGFGVAYADTLWIDGVQQTAGSVVSLDSTVIGGTTPAAGTFTTLKGKFATVEKSADAVTLSVAECTSTLITNRGWDGDHDQTFTLPEADDSTSAGLKFTFLAVKASTSTADTYFDTEGSTTNIYLDGTAIGDGDRVWTQEIAVAESIECYCATIDGSAYDWFCESIVGTWADKGG